MIVDFNVVDTDTLTEWIVKSILAHVQFNNKVIDVTEIMNILRRLEALAYSWIDSFGYVFVSTSVLAASRHNAQLPRMKRGSMYA